MLLKPAEDGAKNISLFAGPDRASPYPTLIPPGRQHLRAHRRQQGLGVGAEGAHEVRQVRGHLVQEQDNGLDPAAHRNGGGALRRSKVSRRIQI